MVNLRTAAIDDISEIMRIEMDGFIPQIQENKDTFLERIKIFNEGFLIFEMDDKICGYICTELWNQFEKNGSVSELQNCFKVGHSINQSHSPLGKKLYISSFALGNEIRGKGYGKKLFKMSMDFFDNHFAVEQKILLVNEEWCGAKKIYSDYGFKKMCTLPQMFYKNEKSFSAGIVMVCE